MGAFAPRGPKFIGATSGVPKSDGQYDHQDRPTLMTPSFIREAATMDTSTMGTSTMQQQQDTPKIGQTLKVGK